jgi:hypothetical protein
MLTPDGTRIPGRRSSLAVTPRPTITDGVVQAIVELRRARIFEALGGARAPVGAGAEPLPADRLTHFRREAEELYWTELSWEELTDEEAITGAGHMTEMVFPGFLTFVGGLLVAGVPHARPHPDAVEEILGFLAERFAACSQELENGIDSQKVVWARQKTAHLLDLVLYRLYRLSPQEIEAIETPRG